MRKIKVAYVCVHNSCRSQMAEAVTKMVASDVLDAYSAGTETKPKINQDAVKLIDSIYQYDMNVRQSSKLIDVLPKIDVVITMGCNVDCPYLPCQYREDWGLDDPTGLGEAVFQKTHDLILEKINHLKSRILSGEISIK